MSTRLRRSAVAALAAMLIPAFLAACGSVQPRSYNTGPRDLVLQLVDIPGALQPGQPTSIMPTFSMYGNGRVIVSLRDKHDGALPEIRELQLSRERTQQLVVAALDAGVQSEREIDIDISPDAPTSLVTLNAEGRSGTTQLGPEAGGQVADLREAMLAYAAKRDATAFEPRDGIAVISTTNDGGSPSKKWPFSEIQPSAEQEVVNGTYCTVYRRVGVSDVAAAARSATTSTSWLSGNATYWVRFRPMLPHETECSSLVRKINPSGTTEEGEG